MSRQLLLSRRPTGSLFLRGPLSAQQTQEYDLRHCARSTVASILAAATRTAAAAVAVALAGVGLYEALTFSAEGQEPAVACRYPHLPVAHVPDSTTAGKRSLMTADTVALRASGPTSLPAPQCYSSIVKCSRNYTNVIAIFRSTQSSGTGGYSWGNKSERSTSNDSGKARKIGNSKSASGSNVTNNTSKDSGAKSASTSHSNDLVSERVQRNSSWCGVIPSVVGASAERPQHLLKTTPVKEVEHGKGGEATAAEVIDRATRRRRKRKSSNGRGTHRRYSAKKALLHHPVSFASLGAAIFAAGVLAGAGVRAIREADKRDRAAARAADAFVHRVAVGTRARAVERDAASEGYTAYTRQMWSALRILAGTAITNALHTLLFTLRVSPLLFLVADAGLKAGVQAWAGGSTLVSVLQHALLAGGYASAISVLGNWQLLLLPLSVYLLYLAAGKGLKTKDSATSGAIFAENMPIMESRLKAEKDPNRRAALAEILMESLAREYKHKHLLDEGLKSALSQTLFQLRRDLLKGLPPGESCQRAHRTFNNLLSLKFVPTATPAAAGAGVQHQPTNATAAAGPASPPPPGRTPAAGPT